MAYKILELDRRSIVGLKDIDLLGIDRRSIVGLEDIGLLGVDRRSIVGSQDKLWESRGKCSTTYRISVKIAHSKLK